jgi:outer membrane protein OmpA-like peptidoglycan-associated protein
MSELEELPSWAGRSTREVPVDPPAPPSEPGHPAEAGATADHADTSAEQAEQAEPTATDADTSADEAERAEPTATEVETPADDTDEADEADEAETAQPVEDLVQGDDPVTTEPVIAAPPADDAPAEGHTILAEPAAAQVGDRPAVLAGAAAAAAPTVDPIPSTTADPSTAPPSGRRRSRLRTALLGLLGLAVIAGVAYGAYLLVDTGSSEETAATGTDDADGTGDDGTATDADQGADDATGTDDATTAAADDQGADDATGTDDADGEGGEPETVTVQVEEGTDADESTGEDAGSGNDGNREAVFRDGKVFLIGAVPSEEVAELIVSKAAAVVGPDNVVNQYTIDPSTTIRPGESAPLYVEDVVLFGFNSVEIAPAFLPILDLGTLLLSQNPQASVTVVTRTDAVGSEEVNLEVARRRAQTVIDYWVSQGVDRSQIKADPRGEEGTSEDDDAETAALQRRAEFIITGLLD